jgi:hypothetical protein
MDTVTGWAGEDELFKAGSTIRLEGRCLMVLRHLP